MSVLRCLACLAILVVPGHAQHTGQMSAPQAQFRQQQNPVAVDTNLICDTAQQVERFVALFDADRVSVDSAIAAVNAEFQSDDACAIATVLYRPADRVAVASNNQAVFDVVRIAVLGVFTLKGLERTDPTDFFMLVPRESDSTVGERP